MWWFLLIANFTMGKLSVNFRGNYGDQILHHFPHHICLGPNLHSKDKFLAVEEFPSDQVYYETNPFDFTLPLPLLPMKNVPKSFLCGIDPVKRIVEEKAQWQELLKREVIYSRRHCRVSALENVRENVKKNDREKIQAEILLLAKIIDLDPDDQFNGFFNWYYCGGNLNHISVRGVKYLLQPRGKRFNELEAIPLREGQNIYMEADSNKRICCSLESKEPIFQISTRLKNRLVGVRQRKKCMIFSLTNKINPSFVKLDEVTSLKPFTSIDICKGINEMYLMMKTDSSCCIRDLKTTKTIREWEVPDCSDKDIDKWCSAFFGQNRDTVVCLNRKYLRTYDTRAKKMNCIELCPSKDSKLLEECEEISCAIEGCHNLNHPLIYVSTYHHLLAMDLRFPRAFLQRWSHGMKHAPCYLSSSKVTNTKGGKRTEIVLLGSQITKEIHAVINDFSADDQFEKGFSSVFPISLPSHLETLDLAQWHGKLLNPTVQKRFTAVTTGMCCFEGTEEGMTCFYRNAVGDVFQQHVLPKYSQHHVELHDVIEKISNWQITKPKKNKKKLETVTFFDAKKLFERITDSSHPMPKKRSVTNRREKWRISKNRIFAHVDVLAPKIRKVWDVEDEEEWDESMSVTEEVNETDLPPSQEPADKVQEWLGRNIYVSTPVASQETQKEDDSKLNISLSPIADRGMTVRKKINLQSKVLQKKRFVHGF